MNPSGTRPPEDGKYVLREVTQGMFSVDNAYSGNYEFFKGRPVSSDARQSNESKNTTQKPALGQ